MILPSRVAWLGQRLAALGRDRIVFGCLESGNRKHTAAGAVGLRVLSGSSRFHLWA